MSNLIQPDTSITISKTDIPNNYDDFLSLIKSKSNTTNDFFFFIPVLSKHYKVYSDETFKIFQSEITADKSLTEIEICIIQKKTFLNSEAPLFPVNQIDKDKIPAESEEEIKAKKDIDSLIESLIDKYNQLQQNMITSKNTLVEQMLDSFKKETMYNEERHKEYVNDVLFEQLKDDLIIVPTPPSKLDEFFGNPNANRMCIKCNSSDKQSVLFCNKCKIYYCTDCIMRFRGLEHSHPLCYNPIDMEE